MVENNHYNLEKSLEQFFEIDTTEYGGYIGQNYSLTYFISYNKHNLLSISFTVSGLYDGTGNGYRSNESYYTFDLKSGEVISPNQLFSSSGFGDFRRKLVGDVEKRLKEDVVNIKIDTDVEESPMPSRYGLITSEEFKNGVMEEQNKSYSDVSANDFSIMENGIAFFIPILPYGSIQYSDPLYFYSFSDLKPYLNLSGSLNAIYKNTPPDFTQKIVASDKAFFYGGRDEAAKRKSYCLRGDVVQCLYSEGAWCRVKFSANDKESTGWMKTSDLK